MGTRRWVDYYNSEDGSLAAHYENTILITEKEPKILTIL